MPESDWTPLLTLDHEHGTAAVYRDADGAHWLSSMSEDGGTDLSGHEPALEGLDDAVVIVGGVLPPGAERVRCRDARGEMVAGLAGGGAWLARLEDHDMFTGIVVVFEDADGRLVERPAPDGATREAVPGATAQCPACGARGWERVSWVHRWEEEGLGDDRSALRCTRCGHTEEAGAVVLSFATLESDEDEGDPPAPEIPPEWLERHRGDALGVFAKVKFAVYALAAWNGPRSFAGWSHDDKGVTAMTVHHAPVGPGPHVDVETMLGNEEEWTSDRELVLQALSIALTGEGYGSPPAGESAEAASLWFSEMHRESSERAARAATRTVGVDVDGREVAFYVTSEGDAWAAVGRLERGAVVISASGVPLEGIALARIDDPAPYVSSSA